MSPYSISPKLRCVSKHTPTFLTQFLPEQCKTLDMGSYPEPSLPSLSLRFCWSHSRSKHQLCQFGSRGSQCNILYLLALLVAVESCPYLTSPDWLHQVASTLKPWVSRNISSHELAQTKRQEMEKNEWECQVALIQRWLTSIIVLSIQWKWWEVNGLHKHKLLTDDVLLGFGTRYYAAIFNSCGSRVRDDVWRVCLAAQCGAACGKFRECL